MSIAPIGRPSTSKAVPLSVTDSSAGAFVELNPAYNTTFRPGQLTLGLVVPIEAYPNGAVPTLQQHIERVRLAEELGYAAVWLRDVPFHVPSFGDVGQVFDPFVYLGALAHATHTIALGVASAILPLRHPAHVAKAAASADVLSNGRLLLGVASGDRPEEYPALGMSFSDRGERFRESLRYIQAMAEDHPLLKNPQGTLNGPLDMLPKPVGKHVPLLITGGSQQAPDWVAQNGHGWMTYPRSPEHQARTVAEYRARIARFGEVNKPVMQSLYVDILDDPHAPARPIHLGFQSGIEALRAYLRALEAGGINHVALNLRFNRANIETTLKRLAEDVLPEFTQGATP